MVLFVFQFYPVCNFGKLITFRLGNARSERLSSLLRSHVQKPKQTQVICFKLLPFCGAIKLFHFQYIPSLIIEEYGSNLLFNTLVSENN